MTAAAWASPTATWADPLVTWTGDVYAVNATATLAQGTRGRWEGLEPVTAEENTRRGWRDRMAERCA